MEVPAADIPFDRALVDRLVRTQHPDLAGPLTLVENGWDNAIYRLGSDLCVRLPRRRAAVALTGNEQRWLPELAGRLTVAVPAPVRVGAPTGEFPWPWTICAWHEGTLAAEVPPVERGTAAADLAQTMVELHTPAPEDAPHNPVRGVALATRTAAVYERLASGKILRAGELRPIWDRLAAFAPWDGPPLWVHGDPHPANLLLRREHGTGRWRLSALLDFGDLTGGDPATDLAAAWLVFDPDGRTTFRACLAGRYDPATWARARGWALCMGSALAASPRLAAVARHALDQVLLDW